MPAKNSATTVRDSDFRNPTPHVNSHTADSYQTFPALFLSAIETQNRFTPIAPRDDTHIQEENNKEDEITPHPIARKTKIRNRYTQKINREETHVENEDCKVPEVTPLPTARRQEVAPQTPDELPPLPPLSFETFPIHVVRRSGEAQATLKTMVQQPRDQIECVSQKIQRGLECVPETLNPTLRFSIQAIYITAWIAVAIMSVLFEVINSTYFYANNAWNIFARKGTRQEEINDGGQSASLYKDSQESKCEKSEGASAEDIEGGENYAREPTMVNTKRTQVPKQKGGKTGASAEADVKGGNYAREPTMVNAKRTQVPKQKRR